MIRSYCSVDAHGYVTVIGKTAEEVLPYGCIEFRDADTMMAARPGGTYRLKYATLTWEDTTTLAEYKSRKNLEINAARLTANRTAFTFGDKRVACDELSRSDIDGANGIISLTGELPVGWLGAWKAMDNTYISIPDVATWKSFYAAMIAQGTANFVKSQTLKTQLTAATTTAEVNSIVW